MLSTINTESITTCCETPRLARQKKIIIRLGIFTNLIFKIQNVSKRTTKVCQTKLWEVLNRKKLII